MAASVEDWLIDREGYRGLTAATLKWYREQSRPLVAVVGPDNPVTAITRQHVRQVVADIRARGGKEGTVSAAFRTMQAFIRWCAREGHEMPITVVMMEPPVMHGDDEERVEVFTSDELRLTQRTPTDA